MYEEYLIYFRYMAIKTQEKKTSQREAQLDRKVTSLEEELYKTKTQLDREYQAQEAKKAKVCIGILIYALLFLMRVSFCRLQRNLHCGRNRKNGSKQQRN